MIFWLAGGAEAQTPVFSTPAQFAAQQAPLAITTADFNGDNILDLAVANSGTSTISVFLGASGGKYSPANNFPVPGGCEPAYLTSGNFTGASLPDIFVVCPVGAVEVLPNIGAGNFGPAVTTALPQPAWVGNLLLGSIHPALADFNGDGMTDVVIPTFGTDVLTSVGAWYEMLSTGGGNFQVSQIAINGFLPMSVAAGDFNGDGNLDLVALIADSGLNITLQFAPGNGKGGFNLSPKNANVPVTGGSLLEVADLNGDGNLDVVVTGSSLGNNLLAAAEGDFGSGSTGPGSSAVTVFLGDGMGDFKQSFNATETAYMSGAGLANVLGTGNLDLVEASIGGNILGGSLPQGAIEVRAGKGDGTFGNPFVLSAWSSGTVPTDIVTADFNGDGKPDLAVSSVPSAVVPPFSLNDSLAQILVSIVSQFPQGNAGILLNQTVPLDVPTLSAGSLANGATYISGGLVPGSWAQVKGTNLATVTNYVWQAADFAGLGNNLPTDLQGTSVSVNGFPAAVYYVDPSQVNFQVPAGVTGTASVQVTVNKAASNKVTADSAASSPGIFPVTVNGVNYAGGVFADGKYIGDPAVSSAFRKAVPGDQVQLFATGLITSPAGVLVGQTGLSGVTVTIGTVTFPADFAALVAVGEFQINFTVPAQFANMQAAAYPITVAVNGVSSPKTIDSVPPAQVVIPIQP